MTNTEALALNESTAFAMGWKRSPKDSIFWSRPGDSDSNGEPWCYGDRLPDFVRDVHSIGQLLEWIESIEYLTFELKTNMWSLPISHCRVIITDWRENCIQKNTPGHGSTPHEALCLTIIAYIESQGKTI